MISIAIANQKGGVAKTTTCYAIGAELVKRGSKVLLVDLDPQANLTYAVRGNGEAGNIFDALLHPKKAAAEVQKAGVFSLLASVPSLAGADTVLTSIGKEYRLKECLESLNDGFDFSIFDCPPSLGILTINSLTASRYALIPCQADPYSLQGIRQLGATAQAVRSYTNPALEIMGLVICRWNARTVIRRELADVLTETAAEMGAEIFKTRIRESVSVIEAAAVRKSLAEYAPSSNAAKDYQSLTDEILTRINNH